MDTISANEGRSGVGVNSNKTFRVISGDGVLNDGKSTEISLHSILSLHPELTLDPCRSSCIAQANPDSVPQVIELVLLQFGAGVLLSLHSIKS